MFEFADLRKTKVFEELFEQGKGEGIVEGAQKTRRELVRKWLAKGLSVKEIADLLDVSVPEVRRLAKTAPK
jgi:predicted transposase/invertase (TIGR01784 family)